MSNFDFRPNHLQYQHCIMFIGIYFVYFSNHFDKFSKYQVFRSLRSKLNQFYKFSWSFQRDSKTIFRIFILYMIYALLFVINNFMISYKFVLIFCAYFIIAWTVIHKLYLKMSERVSAPLLRDAIWSCFVRSVWISWWSRLSCEIIENFIFLIFSFTPSLLSKRNKWTDF